MLLFVTRLTGLRASGRVDLHARQLGSFAGVSSRLDVPRERIEAVL
jgi:hypothetical protein